MNGCKFPGELIAGDSVSFLDGAPGYPAADGWAMKYRLVSQDSGGAAHELEGVTEADGFRFTATSTATSEWMPGLYAVASWVERASERKTISRGTVAVVPDPASVSPGYDGRSRNAIALDAINAVLEKRASMDQQRYLIEGPNGGRRELWRMTPTELMQLRSHFQRLVDGESGASRGGFMQLKVRI